LESHSNLEARAPSRTVLHTANGRRSATERNEHRALAALFMMRAGRDDAGLSREGK
jgi:hypothetical protein